MNPLSVLGSTALAFATLLPPVAAAAGMTTFDQLSPNVRASVEAIVPDVAPENMRLGAGEGGTILVTYARGGMSSELAVAPDGTVLRIEETVSYRPGPTSARNVRISDAASITEDMVEFALAGDTGRVEESIRALKAEVSNLRPDLSEASYQAIGARIAEMETALVRGDFTGIEMAAVETYRALEQETDSLRRATPLEISMLDYSGFKLSVLARAAAPDWSAIADAAAEASSGR